MYPGKHEKLSLTVLLREDERRRHGGYRYLVTTPTFSHCAFRTREGLREWLRDTGLRLGRRHAFARSTLSLDGAYFEDCMMDEGAFAVLREQGWREVRVLSNGDYVRGVVTWDEEGNTIHYLNPNCRRELLPYVHL